MSLPDLVGGSAQCGPVNPLQQLGKRFGQDRGTQFDSLQPGPEAVAGRPSTFRTQRAPLSEDPAFFSAEPVAPFQVDQLRQALPNVHPHAAWAPNASHSHMAGPSAASAPMTSATASTTAPAWAQDFMQATRSSGKARTGASHFNVQPQRPMAQFPHRPFHAHAMPMMTATRPMRPAHTEPDAIASVSQSSWDSAFTAVDAQHATEAMPTEAQLDTMNADELAATAERLLHAVRNDTSEKFQQSEFLGLMRKLRDREAEVRGADIVDANAKGKAKAEGPPTQAYLDQMLRDATSNAGPTTTGHAQTMQHDALADLQEFWQEEDAAKQTRASATHPTFMGDSGDVAARMREDEALLSSKPSVEVPQDDDFIAKEYNKWTSMGANVSGATQAWEETIENEDFVGRAWQGQQGRGQRGAQHAEWDKLQADWDEFEATTDGIYPTVADRIQQPFPYEAPQYVFHDANPYMANMTRQHLSHTSPSMLDNVLEQEAAVQADPTDASRWYSLGLRQQENEREKQAIAALRKALDIDPKLKDAWLALAVSYTNENDRDEALEALERWVNINDTYRGVVHAYLRSRDQSSNRHRRLANVLMAMARSGVPDTGEPIDADIQMALGVLFNASGEYDKAVDCFRAALSVRPDDWILYNRIGATLSNSGRSQESLEYYQQALNLRPDFARCHFNVSISCLNLKMYREAAEHAYTALTLQMASDDSESPGQQSNSLWEILRVSLELMRRPDLASLCAERDISLIHLDAAQVSLTLCHSRIAPPTSPPLPCLSPPPTMSLDMRALAHQALEASGRPDEAITVNQRALIDKILARYSAEFTVFRELLQNADDACATECELRFATNATVAHEQCPLIPKPPTPDVNAMLTQWTFRNNGKPFSGDDWHRLRRIAEGNPDPERIGAFGVGFYSLFSICEEPIVMSGDELMGFFWKGDALFTRRAASPMSDVSSNGAPWTTFLMALREPTPFPESPLALSQFLATSLTFTSHVRSVALYLDDTMLCRITKDVGAPVPLTPSRHLTPTSPQRMLRVASMYMSNVDVHVDVARLVLLEAAAAAAREKPSLRQTIASAFSKTAAGGIASLFANAFSARTPTADSIASEHALDAAAQIETVHASMQIRMISAHINVSVPTAFSREIERSTKKPPPRTMPLHMVYMSKEALDAMDVPPEDATNVDAHVQALFEGILPRLDQQGRIFIGFRTHQTTSFSGAMAARFIPTVERESMDFIDRYCATWNIELLSIGGFVARAVYENEMQRLGAQWLQLKDKEQDAVLERALHAMRYFAFHRSSPSTRVAQALEDAFFACCTRPCISLLSTQGLRSSDQVRFPSAMLADFCREIPVLPPAHIEAAETFVMQLRARQMVRDITMDDVFGELGRRPLSPDEMTACLQWWCQVAQHPSYEPSLRSRLLRAAVVTTESGVQPLNEVTTFLHTGKLPPTVPLPPTCLVYSVSRSFRPAELQAVFPWHELSVSAWLTYMISLDQSPSQDVRTQHGLTHSPANAEAVLSTLAWAWGHLPKAQMHSVIEELQPLACIPTRAGMQRPGDAYFASVSLFSDLPVVVMPTMPVKGPLEKLLEALGVRRHVAIQLIFDRLLAAGDWSHVDLVVYLAKQSTHLTPAEWDRLRHTALFPAQGNGTERFRAAELFEPSDVLASMGVPLLAWQGARWRPSSDEAKLLFELGLQRHLPLDQVLTRAAPPSPSEIRAQALRYLFEKWEIYASSYTLRLASQYAFVPARDGHTYPPDQVYSDPAVACLGWPVVALSPVEALQLHVPRHPPPSALVERVCTTPPTTEAEARTAFAFLASVPTLSANEYRKFSRAPIVPVNQRGMVAPCECYFLSSTPAPPEYRAVFAYIDMGPDANVFLRACGVTDEPSVGELVHQLLAQPMRWYELCGKPESYLDILRKVAFHLDTLPRDMIKAMRQAPFLLCMQSSREQSETESTESMTATSPIQYELRRASDIVLVDDAHVHMLFGAHLWTAPPDDAMEPLYATLGAPFLSSLVTESFSVASEVRTDTPTTNTVRATIMERTPIFLFEKRTSSAKDIQHDMAWLTQHLDVVQVGTPGLQQTRVLSYMNATWKDVQRCSAMMKTHRQRVILHLASDMELDWFEVASALAKVMLTRQSLPDVLLLMTVLSSPLRSLKRKGFHVDKILAQAQAQTSAPAKVRPTTTNTPEWSSLEHQLCQMFPDVDPAYAAQLLRSFEAQHLAQASEVLLQGAYPRVSSASREDTDTKLPVQQPQPRPPSPPSPPIKPPQPTPTPTPAAPALPTKGEKEQAIMAPKPDMPTSLIQQWKARWSGTGSRLSSLANGTSSIRRPASDDTAVAPTSDIQRHVQNAIQASRPDASRIIQSQSQTEEVQKAANSYCSIAGIDVDLRLAGQVAGMNVFVSADLDAEATLAHNQAALHRMIEMVYRPIGTIFGVDPRCLNVFCDTKGPSIAFNRGGTIFLNLRYYLAWHDNDVLQGRLTSPLISVYFSLAHELAHNLVAAHNSEHEFYFSSIAEQYFMSLAQYIATL